MLDVSFVVPFYNGESTIIRCLDSIYSVGFNDDRFEVIVVDDCSPREARSVLADYLIQHTNLRVIRHEQNKRQGGAKNTGINAAHGDYIVFADQDDYVVSENQRHAIERVLLTRPDMLACQWFVKNEDGSMIVSGLDLPEGLTANGKSYCETWFDAGKCLAPWSYVYKREFLVNTGHPMAENVLMEDADWVAWHLFYANNVEFMPLPIYCWVMNPDSITHGLSWRHLADWVKYGCRKIKDSAHIKKDSPCFGAMMERDGKYNVEQVFKKLWKTDDYHRFFQYIGNDVLEDMKKMSWSGRTTFMLHHPSFVCVCLRIVGPVLKYMRLVKKKVVQ